MILPKLRKEREREDENEGVLPAIFNVFVDDNCDQECGEGVVPADNEHDCEAEESPQERGGPVVVSEPRPPVGGLQDGLERARKVDKHVAHQEKPAAEGGAGKRVSTRWKRGEC